MGANDGDGEPGPGEPKSRGDRLVPIGKRIITRERRRDALELRKSGLSYLAISQRLGFGGQGNAHRAVMLALKDITAEPAADVRNIELARYDEMLAALWPEVQRGAPDSIDTALRVCARRAKLLGLDAPTRTELTGADGGALAIEHGAHDSLIDTLSRLAASGGEGETGT